LNENAVLQNRGRISNTNKFRIICFTTFIYIQD
jgi:hypothetical protein